MHKGFPSDAKLCTSFGKRAHLALALRGAGAQRRVSQADIMREIGGLLGEPVSDATVSRWFSGHFMPATPSLMLALARALGVCPGWLCFGDYASSDGPQLDAVAALISQKSTRRQ